MTSTVATVVQGEGFSFPEETGDTIDDPVTLYTLTPGIAARFESVYVLIQYAPFAAPQNDVWVLRLLDQSGLVLFAQPSPAVPATSVGTLELTWVRQGNDSAQFPLFTYTGTDAETVAGWGVTPMPSFTVTGQGQLTLQGYRGGTAQAVAGTVVQVTVAYTPADGSSVVSTATQGIPLLTPTDSG